MWTDAGSPAADGPSRAPELEQDYAAAWREWDEDGNAVLWDATAADGTSGTAR
ncbi:hypothetical protein IQ279_23215 [Streptomyces verrucosisporus]|uniref:hypothetical protein n=1 Tax=Streptomyces verrucosisporus TaxID=1695161 RepID=UPI0019CF9499|nr:hypothetical protein [Streptomyces verrucosisporus]MBN3932491.1 hypothetical protein [Streptomyces verrucosisporus]